jgi:hypothetical protein
MNRNRVTPMSDSNPFEDNPADEPPALTRPIPPRPSFSPSSPARQSRLEELLARQAELRERDARLRNSRAEIVPEPNFPQFAPTIVFDLDRDIPKLAHPCVTASLHGLIAVIVSSFVNVLAILSVRGLSNFHFVRSMVFGLIQGFGTVYVVFNYSFLRLYAFCRKRDISFSWIVTQFVIVGWIIYLAIGFPDSGCVGVATFLDLLAKSRSRFSMTIAGINTAIVILSAYCQFATLYKAQAYQKVSGAGENEVPNPVRV